MPTKPLTSLSIFFPAYFDEHSIGPLTRQAVETAHQLTDDFEIIIVDDGSPDGTGKVADELAREIPQVRVIHHDRNQGVGAAMLSGYRAAAKDYIFYTDGDAQYDIRELSLLASHAAAYELVIGYRMKRAEGFKRVFTSRVFRGLVFLLFGVFYRDIDCSFKLIRRTLFKKLQFFTHSGLVDAEMLIQAKALGVSVKEVGVHHYPRKFGSSVCLNPGLIFLMLRDLLVLRWKIWKEPRTKDQSLEFNVQNTK